MGDNVKLSVEHTSFSGRGSTAPAIDNAQTSHDIKLPGRFARRGAYSRKLRTRSKCSEKSQYYYEDVNINNDHCEMIDVASPVEDGQSEADTHGQ